MIEMKFLDFWKHNKQLGFTMIELYMNFTSNSYRIIIMNLGIVIRIIKDKSKYNLKK